jgi:hypothetical protein
VAERLVDIHQAFYRIFFLAFKGLVDTHLGFYRKALYAFKRLVDTHLAFYRILRWHNKGWWIPTKLFIEFNFGITKAGGSPPGILANLILALKRLVDSHQAFYRMSLWQKGWWISTKLFIEYFFWH